jgi:hypothetical protein
MEECPSLQSIASAYRPLGDMSFGTTSLAVSKCFCAPSLRLFWHTAHLLTNQKTCSAKTQCAYKSKLIKPKLMPQPNQRPSRSRQNECCTYKSLCLTCIWGYEALLVRSESVCLKPFIQYIHGHGHGHGHGIFILATLPICVIRLSVGERLIMCASA